MGTTTKTTRRIALFAMIGIVSALVAGCASHSNDFLSNIRPDDIGHSSESAD